MAKGGFLVGLLNAILSSNDGPKWHTSENGNPTTTFEGYRATVFESDGGWKYVFSREDDSDEPHFSDAYRTKREAMDAALEEF